MTSLLFLVALLMGSLLADPSPAMPAEASPQPLAELAVGDHVLWDGPAVDVRFALPHTLGGPSPHYDLLCEPGATCFDYVLRLLEPGWRLRAAIDLPYGGGVYDIAVFSPDGERTETKWGGFGAAIPYSMEAFVRAPEAGDWRVRLYAIDGQGDVPHLRAKLEGEPTTPEPPAIVLPDLRPEPPFRLGRSIGAAGEVARNLGGDGTCTVYERQEEGARRCLRFAFGWQNVGDGPFDLLFQGIADSSGSDGFSGPVAQRVHWSDGREPTLRAAGGYSFHLTHAHFHYADLVRIDVYPVLDPDAGLVGGSPVASNQKLGVCGHDWKMVDFDRFYQGEAKSHDSGLECGYSIGTAGHRHMGLSPGWADFYGSGTDGNYVEMGGVPDGEYIVRMTLDPNERILESREDDNVGYAHVRLEGGTYAGLGRGYGESPWDPDRTELPPTP